MSANTSISWTHHTFNPWSGCAKVSAGCTNCYAANLPPAMRRHAVWGEGGERIPASESYWRQPIAWDRAAAKLGERHRVFCASVADVFEDRANLDAWRDHLMALIALTPNLDWQLLTKRPEYAARYLSKYDLTAYPNLWIGTSVEDQRAADERIPHLLKIPARVRFLSCEPLLGSVDLTSVHWPGTTAHRVDVLRGGYWNRKGWEACGPAAQLGEARGGFTNHSNMPGARDGMIGWVIVGGESGHKARPMDPAWARLLRDQCVAADVPFHFKQWGEWGPWEPGPHGDGVVPPGPSWRVWADGQASYRPGKHHTGRILDGRTWDQMPEIKS